MSKAIESPSEKIDRRQASIYRLSAVVALFLILMWAPVMFLAGKACRPMGQALITGLLVLFAMPILLLRVIIQVVETWPNKRIACRAVAALLAPVLVYVLLQWLILDVRGIIYEP